MTLLYNLLLSFTFKDFVTYMSYASLLFIMTEIYLSVNKLWKRKHEKVVAESISLSAKMISLVPLTIFAIDFFLKDTYAGMMNNLLIIFFIVIQILIGTGLWVVGQREKGFWRLIRESLSMERQEAGELARSIFGHSSAPHVIHILNQIALIDNVLDIREKEFIQKFADSWGIPVDWDEFVEHKINEAQTVSLNALRDSMQTYLDTSPPENQVKELGTLLQLLVKVDDEVTQDEELILDELMGLIYHYLGESGEEMMYEVAIVPQNEMQEQALYQLIPNAPKYKVAGGFAFTVGPYFSHKFAEVVCERYRSLNFFSVAVHPKHIEKSL